MIGDSDFDTCVLEGLFRAGDLMRTGKGAQCKTLPYGGQGACLLETLSFLLLFSPSWWLPPFSQTGVSPTPLHLISQSLGPGKDIESIFQKIRMWKSVETAEH